MEERTILVGFEPTDRDRGLAKSLEPLARVHFQKDLSRTELDRVRKRVEVLIVGGWRGTIGREIISSMSELRLIQALAAGVNHVPFSSLKRSVMVSTGSGASSPQIAEHVFALMLSTAKNVVRHTEAMRKGLFPQGEESRVLYGRILGVLGVGSIGSHVTRLGKCLGMVVFGCDIKEPPSEVLDRFYDFETLKEFLGEVDFLVISVPLTKKTEELIGKAEISSMKPDATLVNVSRGAVIKEKDLFDHLKANPSFTACLDVWWKYTADKTFKQNLPFERLDNVVMTPHNAAFYRGYHEKMVEFAFNKVLKYLKGESLEDLADPSDYV